MKNFITGKGNTVLGIILTIIFFILLGAITGLGGAIGGAIAGVAGFGLAAVIKATLTKGEEAGQEQTSEEEKS